MSELIEKAIAEWTPTGVMKPKARHPRIVPRPAPPAGRITAERVFQLMEGKP